MHLEPNKMTRAQKLQFLSEVQTGKIDLTSLQQIATYFILPSTETPGNMRVITGNADAREFTPEQYRTFMDKIGENEIK